MSNIKSAKKRAKSSAAKALVNSAAKNKMRTLVRKVENAVRSNLKEEANKAFGAAMAGIAKTAKNNLIHKNTAARKISRLNAKIKSLA